MERIVKRSFYTKGALELAPQLLGKIICHKLPDEENPLKFRITVTEAYPSNDDEASYANFESGKAVEFLRQDAGSCCIYAGMILVSCGDTNDKSCHDNVLIRGGYNLHNEVHENYYDNGKGQPCKLSESLHLESSFPTFNLLEKNGYLWIEDDGFSVTQLDPMPRINVPEKKRLRFIMSDHQIV
jgi:DNA-3-methyladenine glycosylase